MSVAWSAILSMVLATRMILTPVAIGSGWSAMYWGVPWRIQDMAYAYDACAAKCGQGGDDSVTDRNSNVSRWARAGHHVRLAGAVDAPVAEVDKALSFDAGAQWPPPSIMPIACSSAGNSASMASAAPLGLPGRVTTSVAPMVPATPRESIANGVRRCP